jgi:hypothetical protein
MEFDTGSAMRSLFVTIAMPLIIILLQAPTILAMPKTVVVIRHAEKPSDESNIHLSEKGYARAAKLPQFFLRFDSASAIRLIAQGQKRADSSLRPIETVMPASQQFQQTILHQFVKGESRAMVDFVRANHAFDGKTVVISWGHDELGSISAMLGANQGEWSSKIFDRAWVFRFDTDGALVRFEDVAQDLK